MNSEEQSTTQQHLLHLLEEALTRHVAAGRARFTAFLRNSYFKRETAVGGGDDPLPAIVPLLEGLADVGDSASERERAVAEEARRALPHLPTLLEALRGEHHHKAAKTVKQFLVRIKALQEGEPG